MIHHPECRFSVVPRIQDDEAVPDHQQVLQSNLGTVARDPDGNANFGEGSASETGAINSDSHNPTAPFASAQPPSSWLFTRSCCTAQHCSGSCFLQFFAATRVRALRTRKQLVRRVVEGQGPGLSWAEESADGLADFPSIPSRTNSQVNAKGSYSQNVARARQWAATLSRKAVKRIIRGQRSLEHQVSEVILQKL